MQKHKHWLNEPGEQSATTTKYEMMFYWVRDICLMHVHNKLIKLEMVQININRFVTGDGCLN